MQSTVMSSSQWLAKLGRTATRSSVVASRGPFRRLSSSAGIAYDGRAADAKIRGRAAAANSDSDLSATDAATAERIASHASAGPSTTATSAPPSPAATDSGLEQLFAGKSFTCTQCGKCCTGSGEVWVSEKEQKAIAVQLGISLGRFQRLYCQGYSRVPGWRMLKYKMNASQDCIFLHNNKCIIHTARPIQCRTYPWWPELMQAQDWAWERDNVCEGFNHADAPPLDVQDAARQLREATVHGVEMAQAFSKRRGDGAGNGSQRSPELEELFALMAQLPRPAKDQGDAQTEGTAGR